MRALNYDSIFKVAYQILAHSVVFGISATPLAILLLTVPQPLEYLPLLLISALLPGPVVGGIFSSLLYTKESGNYEPFRATLRGIKQVGVKSFAVWAIGCALTGVIAADVAFLSDSSIGALLIPLLIVLAVLAIPTIFHALQLITHGNPALASLRAGIYLSVRRPVVTLVILAILALWIAITAMQPIIGLFVVSGILLMGAWAQAYAGAAALNLHPAPQHVDSRA